MYRNIRFVAAGAMALSLVAAKADGIVSTAPVVHVPVGGVESQAQLAQTLRAEGYSDVVLTSVTADPTHPHPELNPAFTANPQGTPVRAGWNGVAVKDGRTVQVYADIRG